ncbi:unnamed protein product [Owenia fusiformis]|uniref:ShKT domain-containing protein n=1 Tax=Owenia fusiformis TaxID=6347 RepID=A0A8S4PKQ5_OWEFU|nr:unnamed protein product [Owenia fusiformis]
MAIVPYILLLLWCVITPAVAQNDATEAESVVTNEAQAASYLMQFGYIAPMMRSSSGSLHDAVVDYKEAIKSFQRYAYIPQTGEIDAATIRMMNQPRCGDTDKDPATGRTKRYKTFGKWPNNRITYKILNYTPDLSRAQVERDFTNAFKIWSDVTNLSFHRVYTDDATLTIKFGSYDHGDGSPFDGRGQVLAHAALPQGGYIHFDESESWTANTAQGTNLLWVAVHEFGHAIGLRHSDERDAVMYAYYQGYKPNLRLHTDDIQGIQSIYGGLGVLGSWTQWTTCSKSCGTGVHSRTRSCSSAKCASHTRETRSCNTQSCSGGGGGGLATETHVQVILEKPGIVIHSVVQLGEVFLVHGQLGDPALSHVVKATIQDPGLAAETHVQVIQEKPGIVIHSAAQVGEMVGGHGVHGVLALKAVEGECGEDLVSVIESGDVLVQLVKIEDVTLSHAALGEGVQGELERNGECTKSANYMRKFCKKSCGVCSAGGNNGGQPCTDSNQHCAYWQRTGECNKNPQYMRVNCKKSCGVCGEANNPMEQACTDNNSMCSTWSRQGECAKNPRWMLVNCKRSCRVCT